jgi:molybdopterin/thiamine biosynthesis adenylyltransferase
MDDKKRELIKSRWKNDNKFRTVLIIGVGGIGSYLVPLLLRTGLYKIHLYDPDTVEAKNLSYQNFTDNDIGELKVNGELFHDIRLTKYPVEVLTEYQMEKSNPDLIICCADNLDVRKLLYTYGFQDKNKIPWLDLRAQARNGALISYLTDEKLMSMFLSGPEGSFSCQGEDFNKTHSIEHLHFTHVAIAGLAAQWVQRWFNGDEVIDKKVINI